VPHNNFFAAHDRETCQALWNPTKACGDYVRNLFSERHDPWTGKLDAECHVCIEVADHQERQGLYQGMLKKDGDANG